MSSLAHQRVLRTVRLLPQAVKIGILEKEIEQSGAWQDNSSANKLASPLKSSRQSSRENASKHEPEGSLQVKKDIEDLSAQIKALTNSLSNAEVKNMELTEAKKKLESEINNVKLDYEKRRKALENEAEANARKIADRARDTAIAEGQIKGYEEGLEKARREVENEYLEKFSALAGVIENVGKKLDENFNALVKLNQPRLIRVWTEMLKRMLHKQIELHPDTIDKVLSDLLSRLSDKNQILIYVSPDDAKHLEGKLDRKFQEVLRGAKKVELKADPNVETGSCIVETALGVYDARWKTQMSQIEAVIDEVFH